MPYSTLAKNAFWKLCRDDPAFRISEIYNPKKPLLAGDKIATAGSCFAQNISRELRRSDHVFLDVEPTPNGMDTGVAARFGYGLYSARYGNIYTARQLLQLMQDAVAEKVHDAAIWERGGRFYDALRPGVEPQGLTSPDEVRAHRMDHLRRVLALLRDTDVFIFTLGLTEAWQDRASGQIYPTAPGVIAGQFDATSHGFVNMGFGDVHGDMVAVLDLLQDLSPGSRIILTVSPVPLTATATGQHVLAATTYSKSVLRAVAGDLCANHDAVDYFPSYEIITGLPFGIRNYGDNLRSVTRAGVDTVMDVFFARDGTPPMMSEPDAPRDTMADDVCEDVLLEAFADK